MITKETAVLLVLCILRLTHESSTHRESGLKGHEQLALATVSRNVTGTGFHRHFTCQFGLLSDVVTPGCHLAVHLQVPREMYFDIDQISMLNDGKHITVYSPHPVSTELPTDAVEESRVWLFAGVESDRFEIRLPIHMRYQPPREQGYADIHSLPEPLQLLVNCESSESLQSATGTALLAAIDTCKVEPAPCPWREVKFTLPDSHHQWEGRVPCGVTSAAPFITLTTVLATLLCTGFLLHVLIAASVK